ncbi:hypothetical protein BRARA_B02917, partial [Brassica rapa]
GVGGPEEEENQWPPWLKPLLKEEHFFVQCDSHGDSPKNKCNMYCLDCTNGSFCPLCLEHHKDHRTIQIRRLSYHNVIRVNEIQMHLDILSVQTYVIDGAKVVFLNERPQLERVRGVRVTNACDVCSRGLADDCFCFCSLGCKNSSNISGVENNIPNPQSVNASTTELPTSTSLRKRPRKGIPYRSPLQ